MISQRELLVGEKQQNSLKIITFKAVTVKILTLRWISNGLPGLPVIEEVGDGLLKVDKWFIKPWKALVAYSRLFCLEEEFL